MWLGQVLHVVACGLSFSFVGSPFAGGEGAVAYGGGGQAALQSEPEGISGGTPTAEPPHRLAELKARLTVAGEYSAVCEQVSTHHDVSQIELRRASEHGLAVQKQCPGVAIAADGSRSTYHSADAVSVVNARTRVDAKEYRSSQRVKVQWPRFYISRYGAWGDEPMVRSIRINEEDGLVMWQEAVDLPVSYYRWPKEPASLYLTGLLGTLDWNYTNIGTAIDLAVADGTVLTEEFRIELIAMVDSPEDLGRFEGNSVANGFMVAPGRAELEYAQVGATDVLTVRWKDCAGEDVIKEVYEWNEDGGLPSRYSETYFLVGTGVPHKTVEYSIASLDSDTEEVLLTWSPIPGALVRDKRFGQIVEYRVDAMGGVPSNSELMIRSAAEEPAVAEVGLQEAPDLQAARRGLDASGSEPSAAEAEQDVAAGQSADVDPSSEKGRADGAPPGLELAVLAGGLVLVAGVLLAVRGRTRRGHASA